MRMLLRFLIPITSPKIYLTLIRSLLVNFCKLAKFTQDSKELLILWLADRILKTIDEEDYRAEALELAFNTINESKK